MKLHVDQQSKLHLDQQSKLHVDQHYKLQVEVGVHRGMKESDLNYHNTEASFIIDWKEIKLEMKLCMLNVVESLMEVNKRY